MRQNWRLLIVAAVAFFVTATSAPVRASELRGARPDAGQRQGRLRTWQPRDRRGSYQEPAYARGYTDGYTRGLGAGRDRDRYDPVGSRMYRSGDQGYQRNYGSRDAYKNNYRAGFRQGYEEGYRDGSRGRGSRRQ